MQTFHPELIRHMDGRAEQRSLARRWRMAHASRRNARRVEAPRTEAPAASGAAAVIRTC
jgi:hypothetical protein